VSVSVLSGAEEVVWVRLEKLVVRYAFGRRVNSFDVAFVIVSWRQRVIVIAIFESV
jgi:glutamine amidotransferase PdxT